MTIACSNQELIQPSQVNFPENNANSIFAGFLPLWQLYMESSHGGWKNNDNGRFSNDDASALEAILTLYELTSDERYIPYYKSIVERIISNDDISRDVKDEIRNDNLYGWSCTRYTKDSSRTIFLINDALIWTPLLRSVRLLPGESIDTFGYNELILRNSIKAYDDIYEPDWVDIDDERGLFEEPYYKVIGINMPLNHSATIGQFMIELYLLTNDEKFRDLAIKMATYVKSQLIPNGEGYLWYYKQPNEKFPQKSFDDFSHAQHVIGFIIVACENNIVFNRNDLNKVIVTFLKSVLDKKNRVYYQLGGNKNFDERLKDKYIYAKNPWLTEYYRLCPYSKEVEVRMARFNQNRNIKFDSTTDFNHFGEFLLLNYAYSLKYLNEPT